MYRKILGLLIIMLGICVLTGCSPTTNIEALKKVKTIIIPVKTVNLRTHKANLQSGANYAYNVDPRFGLVTKMLPVEKEFLDKKLVALESSLAKLNIQVKGSVIPASVPTLQDEYLYIPKKSAYVDIGDPAVITKLCASNKADAAGTISIEFFKLFYDEPFVGSFIKVQARAKIKVFAASGEEIFAREINGESTKNLPQDFRLAVSIPLMGSTGLLFKQDVNFNNSSEYQEYLLKSFNLRNNYGPLYEEAINDLIAKIQKELDTVSQQYK